MEEEHFLFSHEDQSSDPSTHSQWPQTPVTTAPKDYTPSLGLYGNLCTCDIHMHAEGGVEELRGRKWEQ